MCQGPCDLPFKNIATYSLLGVKKKDQVIVHEPWSLFGVLSGEHVTDLNLLQYSCLENSIHKEAWGATEHGIAKNWTQLSISHFYNDLAKWAVII